MFQWKNFVKVLSCPSLDTFYDIFYRYGIITIRGAGE